MLPVLLSLMIAFALTFTAIPVIIRMAVQLKLFDQPDARKLHERPVASLGGVGIFFGFFLSVLLGADFSAFPELQYFFAAALVAFLVGLKDDVHGLSAAKKILVQLVAAAILIHRCGLRINSMHGLFGIGELPELAGLAISYLTVLLIINAFNLVDGVDGLAASMSLLTSLVFGAYFLAAGLYTYALLAFALAGSLAAFLLFNFEPARIFMGDSGALVLGLVNAFLVIRFIKVGADPYAALPIPQVAAAGFSILALPLVDTLRMFTIRILKGRSPFSADRDHLHHLLLEHGLSHRKVTLCYLGLHLSFMLLAWTGRALGPNLLMLLIVAYALLLLGLMVAIRRRKTVPEEPLRITEGARVVQMAAKSGRVRRLGGERVGEE